MGFGPRVAYVARRVTAPPAGPSATCPHDAIGPLAPSVFGQILRALCVLCG
jgi:hypothetical protein